MEKWLPIKEYEGLYEVSSYGRVRSLDALVNNRYGQRMRRGRILSLVEDRAGYLQVQLSNGKVRPAKVHRLVARAFIGEPPHETAHVNHVDFDKANNRVTNLEWCNALENIQHSSRAGRMDGAVSPKRAKKLSIDSVCKIREAIARGDTQRKVAADFNVCIRTVRRILKGKIWIRA